MERYIASVKEMAVLQCKLAGDLLFFYDTDAPLRGTAEAYQGLMRVIQQQASTELVCVKMWLTLPPIHRSNSLVGR